MKWLDVLSKGLLGRISRSGLGGGGGESHNGSCMLHPGSNTSKLSSVLFPTSSSSPLPATTTTLPPKVLIFVGTQHTYGRVIGGMGPVPLIDTIRDVFHPLGTLDGTNAASLRRHLPTWERMGGVLLTSMDAVVGAATPTEAHDSDNMQGRMWEWACALVRGTHPPHMDAAAGLLLRLCTTAGGMMITSVLAYLAIHRYGVSTNIHGAASTRRPMVVVLNEQEWRLKYASNGSGLKRPLTSITALWRPALDPLIASTVFRHTDLTNEASRPFVGEDMLALGEDAEAAVRDAMGGIDTTRYYLTLRQKLIGGCFDACSTSERWGMKALVETAHLGRKPH